MNRTENKLFTQDATHDESAELPDVAIGITIMEAGNKTTAGDLPTSITNNDK